MITPLTTAQLQYAETRNPYWLKQLGAAWAGNRISAQLPSSPQFAQAVWVFQLARGLTADGICGPNTNTKVTATGYVPVLGAHRIQVARQPVPCDFPVVCKGDPGALVFTSCICTTWSTSCTWSDASDSAWVVTFTYAMPAGGEGASLVAEAAHATRNLGGGADRVLGA